jgi:hypothetical protein
LSLRDFSTHPRPSSRLSSGLWLAAGGLVLLFSASRALQESRDARYAERVAAEARQEVDRTIERTKALKAGRWPGDETVASRVVLTADAPPRAVLSAIERVLPASVRLTSVSLAYGRYLDVEMQVGARNVEAYDEFLAQLGRSPHFEEIAPGAESRAGAVQATVRARFRSPS